MNITIDAEELTKKPIQIALEFLRTTIARHRNMSLQIGCSGPADLLVKQRGFRANDSPVEPAGYRFTPGQASAPALLEVDSSSGAVAGLIYLGEILAVTGALPGRVTRRPAFNLRLASAIAPLYQADSQAVARALRPDGAMQIWDSWTRQIDIKTPPFVDISALEERLKQFEVYADKMVRYGANGIVVNGMSHMIDYKYLDIASHLHENSEIRLRHRIYHDFFKKVFGLIKERNLKLVVISDQFSYLKEMESWIGPIDIENPKVWQTLTAGLTEVFERFPEIDGIMTRYGQHDASEQYRSQDIFHTKGKPVDTHVWGDYSNRPHDIGALAKLIKTVTETCLQKGKISLFRTWTQTEKDVHSRKDLYQKLVDALSAEIRENTIFSIKRTLTDFWYHQPVNPTLACTGTERMVEFECRHEFEGMGVFPAYWEKDNKEALRYAVQQGVNHIWFWPDAGGWVTPDYPVILPYVSGFDFWIDANVFQVYRLIWDPEEESEKTATDFGALNLDFKSGKRIARILQMAYQACSRIFYTLPFARRAKWKTMSPFWHLPWLGIDPGEIDRILAHTNGSTLELVEESAKGVEWATVLEREAGSLTAKTEKNRTIVKQIRRSAFHLKKLAELMHAFRLLFSTDPQNVKEVRKNVTGLEKVLARYIKESNLIRTEGFEEYLKTVTKRLASF